MKCAATPTQTSLGGAGHVHAEGNQLDGVGAVQLSGLGAHSGRSHPLKFRETGKINFWDYKPSYPDYSVSFVSKQGPRSAGRKTNTPFEETSSSPSPTQALETTVLRQKVVGPTPMHLIPLPSFSNTTSSASSRSLVTPIGGHDPNVKIRSIDQRLVSPSFCRGVSAEDQDVRVRCALELATPHLGSPLYLSVLRINC